MVILLIFMPFFRIQHQLISAEAHRQQPIPPTAQHEREHEYFRDIAPPSLPLGLIATRDSLNFSHVLACCALPRPCP